MADKYNGRELPRDVPGLQGLRGIAVLAVVTSHLPVITFTDPHFTGLTHWSRVNQTISRGFLGVDLFFVLSGFLITSLLFRDRNMHSASMLRHFYIRRALRLFPALYALLSISLVVAIWEGFPLAYQWNSTWTSLLFVTNLKFYSFLNRTQNDIGHLWSLAVEEQFYFLWPLLFVFLRRIRIHYLVIVTGLAFIILSIAIHRNSLWHSELPWMVIYVRTDARADSILVGCICAYIYRYVAIPPRLLRIVGYSSAISIVVIAYQYAAHDQQFLYQGGFTLIALLVGVVILAVTNMPTFGGRTLQSKILKWCGERSYGLYLWHLLIFRVFSRHVLFGPQLFRIAIAVAISITVTEISWRWIEQPFIRIKNRNFSH